MKEKQPKIEIVKIGTIKPNPGNPRSITKEKFEKLKKSILDTSIEVKKNGKTYTHK